MRWMHFAAVMASASCSFISLDEYTRGSVAGAGGAASTSSSATSTSTSTSTSGAGGSPATCNAFGPKKTLFPGPAAPTAIAADHAAVYWIEQTTGLVQRVDKITSQVMTLLDSRKLVDTLEPIDIGLLPNEVVFIATGYGCGWWLWHVPKAMPNTGDPKLLYNGCTGQTQPSGLAVVGNELFIASPGRFDTTGRIATVTNLMPGNDVFSTMKTRPVIVAADGQHVYFTEQSKSNVVRIEKNGANQEEIATNQGNVLHIEVDDGFVYWTSDAGRILRLDKKTPGKPITVADNEPTPTDLTIDTSCLYWTAAKAKGGVLHSMAKTGGEVFELATTPTGLPQSVAVDDDGVYYADEMTGEIVMFPRL
jgi:hypothetical protein